MKLNWKTSINDLMALLGMDHSPEAIKELAVELGCPASELGDSYKRNVWTHQALLKKISENGGNIPQNLLH
jgi:phenylalanyl-tRNA synthetase beta subunit